MCHCHRRFHGVFLILLGVIMVGGAAFHHYHAPCRHEAFEQHIAEVCVRAAEGVHHSSP
jgi:hypothetical protein